MNNVAEEWVDKAKRIVRIATRRRWLVLGVAASVALVCGVAINAVPDRYEATARIYVDTQTVLKPLMANITFQPDIDQQVSMLARTLISRPNVEKLVGNPALRFEVSGEKARDEVVTRLMKQIKVAPTASGNLFEISYRGPSPDGAQRLVEAIMKMFVHAGAGAKKRDSQDAGRFIEDRIHGYEIKLTEAESRLKDFKVRNFGVSGVSTQDYFARVSELTEQVSKLRIDVSAAAQSRDSYRRELATEDPQLPPDLAMRNGGGSVVEAEARLDAQKKILDELLRRYTDVHPDVTSARRAISQMELDVRERRETEERAMAKGGKSGKAATSPVYQKLRISLAEAESQVASLRSQHGAKQEQLEQVRALAGRVPQVEAELAQLNRDYDIIRKNYDLMVARREAASLGEKLDESSQLAEFRLVEPPRVSPSPVFPASLHLAAIAVIASIAAGVATAVAADIVWPTFTELSTLRALSGRPVLGSVSMFATPNGKRRQRASAWWFAGAFGILMALQIAWLAWIALKLHF